MISGKYAILTVFILRLLFLVSPLLLGYFTLHHYSFVATHPFRSPPLRLTCSSFVSGFGASIILALNSPVTFPSTNTTPAYRGVYLSPHILSLPPPFPVCGLRPHHVTTHLTPTSAFIPSPGLGLSHPFAKRNFSESSLIGMYLVPTPPLPILCIFYIPKWWFLLPPPSLCPVSRPLARPPQTPHRRVYLIVRK